MNILNICLAILLAGASLNTEIIQQTDSFTSKSYLFSEIRALQTDYEKLANEILTATNGLTGEALRVKMKELDVTNASIYQLIAVLKEKIKANKADMLAKDRKASEAMRGTRGAGGESMANMYYRAINKLRDKNSATRLVIANLKKLKEEYEKPLVIEMIGTCTIENKSAEVLVWEKKHQMEIVEKDGKIRIIHNGGKVSGVVSLSRLKGIPSISISRENLVLKYTDAEKPDNIIMYYPQDNKLMQKTETSGTRALFEISPETQNGESLEDKEISFEVIESHPVYPGCSGDKLAIKKCFSNKIQKHFSKKFDSELPNELGLSSGNKRVFIGFKIDKQGNVVDIQVRAPHPKIKREVVKVMKQLPKMKPGKQRGKPVAVRYNFPITFFVE